MYDRATAEKKVCVRRTLFLKAFIIAADTHLKSVYNKIIISFGRIFLPAFGKEPPIYYYRDKDQKEKLVCAGSN